MSSLSSPVAAASITDSAARAHDVVKIFGKGDTQVVALDHVSVAFPREKFTAIMGPSGSGKSTLMHCLAGLDSVSSGAVSIGGTVITGMNDTQLTILRRDHVGFVFQAFNLVPTLDAEQNILLPSELAKAKVDREWFEQVVDTLGLRGRLKHRPSELSGGQQQRVAVARALLGRPDVIFADEPTGNLDSKAGAEVLSLLRRASREMGQTIIMVTHDPAAAAYSDRVVLLADGRIAGDLEGAGPDEILAALGRLGA